MDSISRAHKMMELPTADLPEIAIKYIRHLGKRYGLCGEVILTALCHYAQVIEGLSCEDAMYKIDDCGIRFFNNLRG